MYFDAFTPDELHDWVQAVKMCVDDLRSAATLLRRAAYARAAALGCSPAASTPAKAEEASASPELALAPPPAPSVATLAAVRVGDSASEWTAVRNVTEVAAVAPRVSPPPAHGAEEEAASAPSPWRCAAAVLEQEAGSGDEEDSMASVASSEMPRLEIFECTAGEEVERIGLSVSSLPPNQVLVKRVENGSWAYQAGIESGDFILGVNGVSVHEMTSDEFKEALSLRPMTLKIGMEQKPGAPTEAVGEQPSLMGWVTSTASVLFS